MTITKSSAIRDNHFCGSVAEYLEPHLTPGAKLSVVSAYLTIYAYDALKEQLDRIEHMDFLFGEPKFVKSLDPAKSATKEFIIEADGLTLSNKLQQKRIARECAEWIRQKVAIRSVKRTNFLHGKLYHVRNGESEAAVLGSSNFTPRGLGLQETGNNIELNLAVESADGRAELKRWFDRLWNDPQLVADVKEDVLLYLAQIYQNHAPEFVYYKTLYDIFEKFLGDARKTDADLDKTTLFDTEVWKALFDFQKDGVKGIINKILTHNGCILADGVGLGKTYEALAAIKFFELRNERVLVLCPKKLRENWTVYRLNDALNPFGADRFRYDVLSHTDLSRDSGYSGDINLERLNWGNYDLVVIDESHNFRNNTPGKRDEAGQIVRRSRYQRLMEDIIASGVRTKVLLLSATPVNIPTMPQEGEIDLLIATDCISEGQNLQDCDYLVNYDIHWNPVRIIQRFGRIDRIGSLNATVQLVNFWPTQHLDKYISLKHRVEARMALVDIAATFEDNLLRTDELQDLIQDDLKYRDRQLLRLKDEVLDIEDLDETVSLTEFTLDDFRIDLLKYLEANRSLLDAANFGLYTVVPPHADLKTIGPGVIWCFRQSTESAKQPGRTPEQVNPLQPYFLVYVLEDGNVRLGFAQPKQILGIYRELCAGKTTPYEDLCTLFDRETTDGQNMQLYSQLLQKAVDSIAVTFRKRVAAGLQSGRGFVIPDQQEQATETSDFELVTWLVIKRTP